MTPAYRYSPALTVGTAVACAFASASLALAALVHGLGLWLAFAAIVVGLARANWLGEGLSVPRHPAPPHGLTFEVSTTRAAFAPLALQLAACALVLFALGLAGFRTIGVGGGLALAFECVRALRQVRAQEAVADGPILRYTRRSSDGGRVPGYAVVVAGVPGVSAVPDAPAGPTLAELSGGP